jgi:hypothetical protein
VAELVDARDLKCLASPESSHFFGKRFGHQPAGTNRDLENTFWGPLMAVTVNTARGDAHGVRAPSTCPYRKSNPGILMMETAQDRAADNSPGPLGAARERGILVQ